MLLLLLACERGRNAFYSSYKLGAIWDLLGALYNVTFPIFQNNCSCPTKFIIIQWEVLFTAKIILKLLLSSILSCIKKKPGKSVVCSVGRNELSLADDHCVGSSSLKRLGLQWKGSGAFQLRSVVNSRVMVAWIRMHLSWSLPRSFFSCLLTLLMLYWIFIIVISFSSLFN